MNNFWPLCTIVRYTQSLTNPFPANKGSDRDKGGRNQTILHLTLHTSKTNWRVSWSCQFYKENMEHAMLVVHHPPPFLSGFSPIPKYILPCHFVFCAALQNNTFSKGNLEKYWVIGQKNWYSLIIDLTLAWSAFWASINNFTLCKKLRAQQLRRKVHSHSLCFSPWTM